MVGVFIMGAMLAQGQNSAIIFGGGNEAPIPAIKLSHWIRPTSPIGWDSDQKDGTLVYKSPKNLSFVFLPSLREVVQYRAMQFCRTKLEKDGFNAKITFGELTEAMQNHLRGSMPYAEFQPKSQLRIQMDAVANIAGMGRKMAVHRRMMKPGSQERTFADLEPIRIRQILTAGVPMPNISSEYQIFHHGLMPESNRYELIHEAMSELHKELARRMDEEKAPLIALFRDFEPYKTIHGRVGQGINLNADRLNDPWGWLLANSFRQTSQRMGIAGSRMWEEFCQQAKIESTTLGFNLEFVSGGPPGDIRPYSIPFSP